MGFAPTTLPTGQRSLEEIFAVSNVLNEPEDFVKGKIHILTNKIRKEGQTGQFYFYRTNILVQNLINCHYMQNKSTREIEQTEQFYRTNILVQNLIKLSLHAKQINKKRSDRTVSFQTWYGVGRNVSVLLNNIFICFSQ